MTLTWDVLNVIGTIAFAVSGTIIAIEEDYDILGVLVLGLTTAFGGGAVRDLLIGIPIKTIWDQGPLFEVALIVIFVVFLLPMMVLKYWNKWGTFFDAIGLAAFTIQGASYAVQSGASLVAIMFAASLTGAGGGMIRDILARRKPMIFQSEVYAAWGILAGLIVGLNLLHGPLGISILFISIVVLRMLSVSFNWRLPKR